MYPLHEHDCERCIYLGGYNNHDLYACPEFSSESSVLPPTVIARYGPDGDYYSGIVFADFRPELGEALRRAIERGVIEATNEINELGRTKYRWKGEQL